MHDQVPRTRRRSAPAFVVPALFLSVLLSACTEAVTNPDVRPLGIQAAVGVDPSTGAMLETDQDDYMPGDVVTITGSGWAAGEFVTLHLTREPHTLDDVEWSVTADGAGTFETGFLVVDEDYGVTFTLTGRGDVSGSVVAVIFTDAAPLINSWSINGGTSAITVAQGSLVTVSMTVTTSAGAPGGANWKSSQVAARPSAAGPAAFSSYVLTCNDVDVVTNNVVQTVTHNFTFVAPAPETYDLRLWAFDSDGCLGANSFTPATSDNNLLVTTSANAAPTLDPIGNKSVAWGNELAFTAVGSDADAGDILAYYLDDPPTPPTGAAIDGSTGAFAWTPTSSQIGDHSIKVCVRDQDLAAACETITVSVTRRATKLVYDGRTSGQYSDASRLSGTLTDAGGGTLYDGDPISGRTLSFTLGTQGPVTGTTDANGLAYNDLVITQAAGSVTAAASFVQDALYLAAPVVNHPTADANALVPFTIGRENARVYAYSAPIAVKDGSADDLDADADQVGFVITASARESYAPPEPIVNDGAQPGEVSNIGLLATLEPVAGGSSIAVTCVGLGAGATYASVRTFTCTFADVPLGTYVVILDVTGDYYTGTYEDALTAYTPVNDFTTGGGTFMWDDARFSFGYTMKFGKGKSSNTQGNMVVIRHNEDGSWCRAKSNTTGALVIAGNEATFSGKVVYSCTDALGEKTSYGNPSFSSYAQDVAEPGGGADRFWVRVSGQADMTMPLSAGANAATLTGGNVQVPQTQGSKK